MSPRREQGYFGLILILAYLCLGVPAFGEGEAYRIDVGAVADYTDSEGHVWRADKEYDDGSFGYVAGRAGSAETVDADIWETADDALFASYRAGSEIEYRFDVETGAFYFVNIKLMEPTYAEDGQRRFNIYLNDINVSVRSNLKDGSVDPHAWSGGRSRAMSIVAPSFEARTGTLRVTFVPTRAGGTAVVSAIEVRRAQTPPVDSRIESLYPADDQFQNLPKGKKRHGGTGKPGDCQCEGTAR